MLGEIVLPQGKCLAELIDNAVDSFWEAKRSGSPVPHPQVHISIPTNNNPGGKISVRDNGPGMSIEHLETAAKAGWTSRDPLNNLGLFGMGFNIATARLGRKTTIWTTRKGDASWRGLTIDFDELTSKGSYSTDDLTRAKHDSSESGTEIVVEYLKEEQREWFSKNSNRSLVTKQLGRMYSSMLGPAADPVGFRLEVNGKVVLARPHCIWGGPSNPPRSAEHPTLGTIDAYQAFDVPLSERGFCARCRVWLSHGQSSCAECEKSDRVVARSRRVHGWLGVQRYCSPDDFGIDFLRNGRKIEVANKELFYWTDESTERLIPEYPIDDLRLGGRIVGEVHLDHCRVPYTKDRFVREDAAWAEMVGIIRGAGPLRPEIARERGFGANSSPLYKLYQVFRRATPHNRRVGGWDRLLAVEDNRRATEMARYFESGDPAYQTDAKWYELVEESNARALTSSGPTPTTSTLGGGATQATPTNDQPPTSPETADSPSLSSRKRMPSLSQLYSEEITNHRYEVEAYSVESSDPDLLPLGTPWVLKRKTHGGWEFLVNAAHSCFRSVTLTPLDALLSELAVTAAEFERTHGQNAGHPLILSSLRKKYASLADLEPRALTSQASETLGCIAASLVGKAVAEEMRSFFEDLPASVKEEAQVEMARRSVRNAAAAIDDGRFLQYCNSASVADFVAEHPELFFDGKYWDDPYQSVEFDSAAATEQARKTVLGYYASLLSDAVWLAQQEIRELELVDRERLVRAASSVQLLAPDRPEDA